MDLIDKKLLEELNTIETLNKFSYAAKSTFSNKRLIYPWFRKVKKEVLTSNDPACIKAKADYEEYLTKIKKRRDEINTILFIGTVCKPLIKEFADCPDFGKFDPNKEVTFKTGKRMGVWFFENYQFLFDSKSPDCLKIAEQYKKKRLLDKEKARRKYRNYRLMFYKESNINKFAFGSNVSFQDGTLMNEWFDKNKENIFDSKQPIDVYIQSQYREFLMYYDLRREFLEEENLDKFNPEGNVRFLTGAIMYFWWERYKDGILTSNFNSDEEIKNQYNEFNDNNVKLKLGKKKF